MVKFCGTMREDFAGIPNEIGLIVELQTRGPVPGAYVFWSNDKKAEWVSIENLRKVVGRFS